MVNAIRRVMSITDVFKSSLNVLKKNPSFFVIPIIPVIFEVILYITLLPLVDQIEVSLEISDFTEVFSLINSLALPFIILGILTIFLAYLMISLFLIGTKNVFDKNKLSLGDTFKKSFSKMGKALALNLVLLLIYAVGILFFIVPGVLFFLLFFYALPIIILEDKKFVESIKHSFYVGKKNIFKTLIYLVVVLACLVPFYFLRSLIPGLLSNIIAFFITFPFLGVSLGVLYLKGLEPVT